MKHPDQRPDVRTLLLYSQHSRIRSMADPKRKVNDTYLDTSISLSATFYDEEKVNRFDDAFLGDENDPDANEVPTFDCNDQFFTCPEKEEEEYESPTKILEAHSTVDSARRQPVFTPTRPTSLGATTVETKSGSRDSDGDQEETLPKYLSHAEKTFEAIMEPFLSARESVAKMVLIEKLRHLAFLEHQLRMVQLDISLWTSYLQSGTGKLKEEKAPEGHRITAQLRNTRLHVLPCIWPERLRSIIARDPSVSAAEKRNLGYMTC